jgi:hypothetical protein
MFEIYYLLETVRNETRNVQCTTHNAVIPFYKLSGRLTYGIS